jgi:hypothetical protein
LIDTVPTAVAIAAEGVLSIERLAEWSRETPLELSELMAVEFAAPEPPWVLELGSPSDSSPILVRGRLHIEHFLADALVAMPTQFGAGFELFTHIVTVGAKPSALVLNVVALRRVLREAGQ